MNIVDIHLPALKDRIGDIPLIASRYIKEFSSVNGNKVTGITPEAMSLLEKYEWPGNVRELRNAIEKMVVLSTGGILDVKDIPENMRNITKESITLPVGTLEETERVKIFAALKSANGNKTLAAESLGISRRTLYRKLDEYAKEGFTS